ncbi:DUF1735 domain-containing protein [Pontibacter sp. 172403-2]|uniref:DUF1735 domain-containing protein n=1 Tax=Pontibacter rufus TaxID=2791028 RepID=UPI0018AFCF47|nr:DUF1735 domain-containing protein [Pontibacter sp. 172403-2]MBF9251824.1 DUF1735 domain-containing protein [Pontibacter sp. 172403-2]
MKKIKNILMLALAVSGLSSCLDEDPIFNPDDSPNIIEIKSAGGAIQSPVDAVYPLYVNSFDIVPEAEFPLIISYSGAGTAPQDITVNLEVDPEAMAEYNAWFNEDEDPLDEEEDHDAYKLLSESIYEFPTTTVTIPAGKREAVIMVKVKPDMLDFDNSYAIPVSITESSAGIISGNNSTAIIAIGAKNEYDGTYTNTYTSTLGNGTNTVDLVTTGQYSVKMLPGLIGVYSNAFSITVDPATNLATVSMTSLLPIATDPSSHWDPATKTFYLKWTSNAGARQFEQTLKMK